MATVTSPAFRERRADPVVADDNNKDKQQDQKDQKTQKQHDNNKQR